MADGDFVPLSIEEQIFAIKTWRYLRLAIVVLAVGLGVAVGYEVFHATCKCFLTSISAYYYTPVHAYFVGALVSIGVCLICLKGNTPGEDVLLNLAGALAPVVAFVPTPVEDHSTVVLFNDVDIDSSVTNNVTALLVVGTIGLLTLAVLSRRHTPPRTALRGYGVAVTVYVAAFLWFELDRPGFVGAAHYAAAIPMFALIVGAVWLNAVGYKEKGRATTVKNRYLAIATAMTASAVAMFIAWCAGWDYAVLVVEIALIGLFAIFWSIQTAELWHDGLR
jgi:hypothetical protein